MRQLTIFLEDNEFEELHKLMNMQIKGELDDGSEIVLYKLYTGKTKQQWYRTIIDKGIEALNKLYYEKEKELKIKHENKDSNRE